MKICPNVTIVRRTKTVGSDRLNVTPSQDIAFIHKIIINIDEPVIFRFLGFHVKNKTYCKTLRLEDADKRFCSDIRSQYVHFLMEKEGYPPEKSIFLLAFLPRIKIQNELLLVVKEICDIIEWLGIRAQTNCIIFRFGRPRHRMDNQFQWQKHLERVIKETKNLYTIGQIRCRIKHIREDAKKYLTVSSASVFDSINIS